MGKRIKELKNILQLIKKREKMTQIGIKMYDMNDIMIRNMAEEKIIISDYVNFIYFIEKLN
ncbi:MAG TPA: hypothetical protein ENG48_02410 [Candidatus Atribacteria bacterium]|nr:hypothetical protein [Candidatus Atribacteria bacterium]